MVRITNFREREWNVSGAVSVSRRPTSSELGSVCPCESISNETWSALALALTIFSEVWSALCVDQAWAFAAYSR